VERTHSESITELLGAARAGDEAARDRLWVLVYDELHRMAARHMDAEGAGSELQTTVLVNEAYLRLVGDRDRDWNDRRHFFAAAAQAMRCIRIDEARRRKAGKRGGGRRALPLVPVNLPAEETPDAVDLLTLDEALTRLEQIDPVKAEIVMLRYFIGLTIPETAELLNISERSVDSQWRFARAWLRRELAKGDTRCGNAT